MRRITDQEFADFIVKRPLYYKVKAVENLTVISSAFLFHKDFADKAFKFLCPEENEVQTFKTHFHQRDLTFTPIIVHDPNSMPHTFNKQTRKLDLTIHLQGVCQSCNHHIDFLVKATSDKKWDERKTGLTITLQKIGQFPSYEIELSGELQKYLSNEDQNNYKRALTCLSFSYGIGAYAYFRRIIENEIKRIIKDISELEFEGVEFVKGALETFEKDFQMSKLINVINKYLPKSLKELGDNPLKLLYEQLSGGIHEFTDKQCIDKALSIDIVLKYVVRKINEEKYQLNDVKSAMRKLRSNNN